MDRRQDRLSVGVKPTWHGLFLLSRIASYMKFSRVDISSQYEVYRVEPRVLISRAESIDNRICTMHKPEKLFIPMRSQKPMWLLDKQGILYGARSNFPSNGTWSTGSTNL